MKQCLILIILFVVWNCPAQESEQRPKAVMLDEYGDLNDSDIKARLDNIALQLQGNAADKIFIVTYRTRYEPQGKNVRFSKFITRYLSRNIGIEIDRIIKVDAGQGFCSFKQIWLAPAGTTPEIKTNFKTSFEVVAAPLKYDDNYYGSDYTENDEPQNSLPEFAAEVKRLKATAYVYLYRGYYVSEIEEDFGNGQTKIHRRLYQSSPTELAAVRRKIRSELSKSGLTAADIKIVNGGYREFLEAESWILPRGVHPPVATPNVFPKVGRRR